MLPKTDKAYQSHLEARYQSCPAAVDAIALFPPAVKQGLEALWRYLEAASGNLDGSMGKGLAAVLEEPRHMDRLCGGSGSGSRILLTAGTIQNLDLVGPPGGQKAGGGANTQGTLFHHMNRCMTPCGSRMLRHWLLRPCCDLVTIRSRQEALAYILRKDSPHAGAFERLWKALGAMPDLERVLQKAGYGRCSPSELHKSLASLEAVKASLAGLPTSTTVEAGTWGGEEAKQVPTSLRESLSRLSGALPCVHSLLGHLEADAAMANDRRGCLSEGKAPARLRELRGNIEELEEELESILPMLRRTIQACPT